MTTTLSAASCSPSSSVPSCGASSSASSSGASNNPPADELAQIRASIQRLETREAELKTLMINDPDARTGNQHVAIVKAVVTNRLDQKELRAMYPAIAAEHTHPVTTTRVELRGITEDGEVVSLRRKPAKD